jgi:Tfp pilus assembly protein PilV
MTRRSEQGFTLVEVMIAVLLTVIGVMGILGLIHAESRSGNRSRHMTEASVLAAGQMEDLRTQALSGTGGSADASPVDAMGSNASAVMYTRSWTWAPGTVANTIAYTTKVTWSEDGQATSVTMIGVRGQ